MNHYLFTALPNQNELNKKPRMLYAAISGFAAGTICALVSSFINVWLYPDLPLYVSRSGVFWLWVLWAGAGTILAGVTAISSEGWAGILPAAFGMAATVLIVNFTKGTEGLFLSLVILLGLALPFTAVMAPVAYAFFWLAKRFVKARTLYAPERRKMLAVNLFVIVLLGFLPGLYSKFNLRTEQAVRLIHETLQEGAQTIPTPLVKTEGFADHRDQIYALSQAPSVYSTVGVDVTAHYKDGYAIQCTVILYPGSKPYISPCKGIVP